MKFKAYLTNGEIIECNDLRTLYYAARYHYRYEKQDGNLVSFTLYKNTVNGEVLLYKQ